MEKYNKKGQAGSVSSIIMLIVGVGVAVLVLIFVGALGGQTYNLTEDKINELSGTITGENFTAVLNTNVGLDYGSINSGTLSIYNASNPIALGNFSIDYAHGYVKLTSATYNGDLLYANYTHGTAEIETSIKNGVKSSFEALEQTGAYLPIIVLAVVIAIVLGLVLGFMAFKGNGGGSAL